MKRKSKMLSILLALAMILTFMPAIAFADVPEGSAAKIGDQGYETLQKAVEAAVDGNEIVLLKSVNEGVSFNTGKTITLDLAGYNITYGSARPVTVSNGTKLTIVSSKPEPTDKDHNAILDSRTEGVGSLGATGNGTAVTIRAGYYYGYNGNKTAIHAIDKAVITFEGGLVEGAAPKEGGDPIKDKEGKVFYAGVNYADNQNNEIPGKIVVKGGTFNGRISNSNWGNYEILGGTFDRNEVIKYNNPPYEGDIPTGGTSVKEGAFTLAESGWIDEGFEPVKDSAGAKSSFTIVNESKVEASVTGEDGKPINYSSIDTALEDAKTGDTLDVKNVDAGTSISTDKDINIKNDSGNTINVNGEDVKDGETVNSVEAADLAAAKKAANAELDAVDLNKYSEPEKTAVANAIAAAKKDIAAAGTIDAVKSAKTAALNAIAAQPVLNEALPKVSTRKGLKLKKAFKARWKKLSKKNRKKISGYEVQYAKDAAFTDSAKIVKAGKNNSVKTVRKLPKKSTYWVRVRTYKVTNGVKQVGAWSKVRKVKSK